MSFSDFLGSISHRSREWMIQRPFAKAVSVLAGGTALAQVVTVLVAPLLTRVYSVSDFGFYQAYTSVLAMGLIVATLRYEFAALLPEDEKTAASLISAGLASIVFVTTTCAALVAWSLTTHILQKSMGGAAEWLWCLPAALFAGGLFQLVTYWGLREKSFSALARSKFAQFGIQGGSQLSFGILNFTVGLIAGDILGRFFAALMLLYGTRARAYRVFRSVTRQSILNAAWRYRNFPFISTGSGILNTAALAIPALLIGYLYGAKTLGLFALVDRMMGAPTILVGQAVSQVYMSEGSRLVSQSPAQMLDLFNRTWWRLLKLVIIPAIALFVFAPTVFALVFGAPWREAGNIAQLLVVRQIATFAMWPLTGTLNLLEEQGLQLWWDACRLLLALSALWIPSYWGLSAHVGIGAYAFALAIGYLAYALVCRRILAGRIRVSSRLHPVVLASNTSSG